MLVHIAVSNDGEYDDVCESRLYKTAGGYLHIWTSGPDYVETVVRDDDEDLYAEVGRSFEPDLMLAAYRRYKINNVECVDCLLRSESATFYYLDRTVGGRSFQRIQPPTTAVLDWLDLHSADLQFPADDCDDYRARAIEICAEKKLRLIDQGFPGEQRQHKANEDAFDIALQYSMSGLPIAA